MTNGKIQIGRVVGNEPLCREHFRLNVALPTFGPASPGQFVHVCPQGHESSGYRTLDWSSRTDHDDWARVSHVPLLRRAFSIAGLRRDAAAVEVDVIYRVVGKGTNWMSSLTAGMSVNVLGPLGHGFPIAANKPNTWMVAGGVGLPPMLWLSEALAHSGKTNVALCGAQTADLLAVTLSLEIPPASDARRATMAAQEFAAHGTPVVISTDDGSIGFHGHVGAALRAFHQAQAVNPDDVIVYTCGPERMMEFVADFCLERNIECHVCMERAMACGTGMCQSCVVPIRDTSADGWHYSLCCTDGPVFRAGDVLWHQPHVSA